MSGKTTPVEVLGKARAMLALCVISASLPSGAEATERAQELGVFSA